MLAIPLLSGKVKEFLETWASCKVYCQVWSFIHVFSDKTKSLLHAAFLIVLNSVQLKTEKIKKMGGEWWGLGDFCYLRERPIVFAWPAWL